MNIEVTVGEIDLNTIIGDVVEYDQDGEREVVGGDMADQVADALRAALAATTKAARK